MKGTKIAVLALTLGMVGALGLSACKDTETGEPEIVGETIASQEAWDKAIEATTSTTNATITFEASFEEREGELFGREEGSGSLVIADGKAHHFATGTNTTNSGSEPFTSESYMTFSGEVLTEWHKENDGAWETLPCELNLKIALGDMLNNYMDIALMEDFSEYYSYCELQNGYYTFIVDEGEGVYHKMQVRFVDGKINYFELVDSYTDIIGGITYAMSTSIKLTFSYGNATVQLPSEIAPDTGDGETGGGEGGGSAQVTPSTEGLKFVLSDDQKSYTVSGYEGTSKEVYIAATHEGLPVTTIGNSAFLRNETVESVVIAEGIKKLDKYSFYHCAKLKSITLPTTVKSIGDMSFWECYDLKAVHISDLVAWSKTYFATYDANPLFTGKNLYLNGELVTELVVPKEVGSINNYAFAYCWSLTKIKIEGGVDIGQYAFWQCKNVTELTIESDTSLVSIGNYAFRDCKGIKSVFIPKNVAWLERQSFQNCTDIVIFSEAETEPSNWDTTQIKVYYYSENEPSLNYDQTDYNGKYWHYGANGEFVIWEFNANE